MTNNELQQLSQYLQAELISFSEAAKKLKVRKDYLVGLAVNGKLQAFKMGEEWYVEPKRLEEFTVGLKRQLDEHLAEHLSARPSVWVKTKKKRISLPDYFWHYILGEMALVTVTVVVLLGLTVSFIPLKGYLLVYCSKYFLNDTLMPATQVAYSAPLAVAESLSRSKINDETLTKKIDLIIKYNIFKRRGRVAGEMEQAGF